MPGAVGRVLGMVIWICCGALAGWGGGALVRRLRRGALVPRTWCAVAVGAAWGAVALRVEAGMPWWWAGVPLALAWLATLLTACDLRAARLPDALTLPAYPAAAALLVPAAAHEPRVPLAALAGVALFAGSYLAVRLVLPGAMGPGDVKLAGPLGALVGAVSLPAVLGVLAVAAASTLVAAAWRRAGAVPHGPAMLLPSWLVALAGP
ncbi:prepilin peptidase [Saccharopolyspora griseoalba]|uniref:Prepilin peptidase n=1 Tax=Saccharopolyspora griseoalba TaxID=1431848 RepID=A0ABW2LMU3_9PSEU